MGTLRKALRLRPGDWRLIAEAYWRLLWAGYRMLRSKEDLVDAGAVGQPSRHRLAPDVDYAWIKKRARFVNAAARFPHEWALCLQRSMALQNWLAAGGVYADLRIGALLDGDEVKAHAWLEYDGRLINDTPKAVSPFVRLASARGRRADEAQ